MTNVITVDSVLSLFQEEVADLGGRVTDKACDERRLFVRAVLPEEAEVVSGDTVKAGVALRCANLEIEIRPYVFRKVCRNGAIVAHSTMGRQIDVSLVADPASTLLEVRQAVRAAAAREAFDEFVHAMRESRGQAPDADHMLIAQTTGSMAEAHDGVVIVHGTDRLAETGHRIVEVLDTPRVPVVITGAMRPYQLRVTDATQNLTESLLAVQLLDPGVYVAMHNRVLRFPGVVKDKGRGTFVLEEPASS